MDTITRLSRIILNGGKLEHIELDDRHGFFEPIDAIIGYDLHLETFFVMFDADMHEVMMIGETEKEFPTPSLN
jgi:hypothetical protein